MSSYAFPRLEDPAGAASAPPAGIIAVTDDAPAFVAIEGGENPGDFTLVVSGNLAGPTLTPVSYDTGEADYLTIGPRQGSGPWSWAIACDITGLAEGDSTFSFDVEDTRDPTPVTVSGTLTIDTQVTQPVIQVSDTTPETSVEEGELSVEFTITAVNALGGSLPGMTLGAPSEAWLSAEIDPDGETIRMQVDATSLTEGQEQATFTVICAAATNTPITVTVTADITTDPVMQLREPVFTYNFPPIPEGSTTVNARLFDILNAGSGTINPSAVISVGDPWLSCAFTETIAGEEYEGRIEVDPTGMADGVHQGTITVSSAGADDIVLTVNMTITEVTPALSFSTIAPSWVVDEGDTPTPTVLTITGNVTLAGPTVSAVNYGAGPSGWLNVSTPTETSPGSGIWTSTLSPATSTFDPGAISCTFTVSDANVPSGPVTITPSVQINDVSADALDVPRAMDGTPMQPPTWGAWSTTTGLIEYVLNGGSFAEPTLPSATSLGSWAGTANIHLCANFAQVVTAAAAQASQSWPIIRITGTIQQSAVASISFPVRTGAGWLCVQTSSYAQLPQAVGKGGQPGWGTRVTESTHLLGAPIWERANQDQGGITFAHSANRYAFQGITWINTSPTPGNFSVFLKWGNLNQTSQTPATEPTDLIVAHCVIDGKDEVSGVAGAANGIMLDGNRAVVRDSIIRGLRLNGGGEEHAILCTVGTGNYLIRNNELEARSICILFGGNQGGAVQRNADCLIEYNHHYRRPSWISGADSSRKNLGTEIKSGQRIWTQAFELENGRPGDQYHEFVYGPKVSGDTDALTCKVKHVGARFGRMWNCTGIINSFNDKSQIGGVERYAQSVDAAQYHYVGHILQVSPFTPTTVQKGPRFGVGTSTAPIGSRTDITVLYDSVMENCTHYASSATYVFGLQTLATAEGRASAADTTPRMVMRNCIDLSQPNLTGPTSTCVFFTGNVTYTAAPPTGVGGTVKSAFDLTCGVGNYILNRVYTRHVSSSNRWGDANTFIGAGGVTMQNFTYADVAQWAFANLAGGDGTITNAALKGTGTDGRDVGPDMPRLLSALASAGGNPVRRMTPTG